MMAPPPSQARISRFFLTRRNFQVRRMNPFPCLGHLPGLSSSLCAKIRLCAKLEIRTPAARLSAITAVRPIRASPSGSHGDKAEAQARCRAVSSPWDFSCRHHPCETDRAGAVLAWRRGRRR
jgi:hypothetical protein